ncbi:hypothetical protein LCGC14_3168240 [marine sediment metagenome]|uniref:Uncharacterized protein n=1 Tax=marine sediment metagenome TaxID=412755 RepID=A0A0F8W5U4_9ZZZZ
MHYFKEIKTLKIVTRQFEFNMEVLDGKLEEIEPTSPCLLLAHVPNKKWSYDVTILEKLDAEDGINRLNPLPQISDKPKEYYTVILETDYNEYMHDYDFREVTGKIKKIKKDDVIKDDPKPRVLDTEKAKTNMGTVPNNAVTFDYSPALARTHEKTVHKFRSGSQRYG